MAKQHKDNIADEAQESLVDALENIKHLLEKSENKLSAARESIALANSSSSRAKALSSEADDEEIPVLEEEIIPTLGDEVQPDLVFDSTSFADIKPEPITPPATPIVQGISSEDVMDLIDELQDRLPPLLNKTITNCSLSSLEGDLFEALQKELHQLRNEVKQLDN